MQKRWFSSMKMGRFGRSHRMAMIALAGVAAVIVAAMFNSNAPSPATSVLHRPTAVRKLAVVNGLAESSRFPDSYRILLEKSIFSSQRRPAETPHEPQALFSLRGIMQEGGVFTAFIEDPAAGRIVKVHAGDPVGRGHVNDISLKSVVYETGGIRKRVGVGEGLNGDSVAANAAGGAEATAGGTTLIQAR